jgi:hypothetical protein
MSTPGMYSFLCKSTETSNKKLFSQVTFLRKVILFGVKHYIRVPNFFFIIWGLWVSDQNQNFLYTGCVISPCSNLNLFSFSLALS